MSKLLKYNWPGNVRELENVIQRGMVLSDKDTIDIEHISDSITNSVGNKKSNLDFDGFSLKNAQKQLEADMIRKALIKTEGNKSKAAILLEISYPSLLSKIKEYSL